MDNEAASHPTAIAPLDAAAHAHAGALAARRGEWARSVAHLRVAVAIAPEDAGGWANLASALRGAGQLDPAETTARQALAMDGSIAAAWIVLGLVALDRKRFDEARDHFRRALQVDPHSPQAHVNSGLAAHALGRDDEAFASYERALELDPDFAPTHYNLGALRHARGEHAEAMRHYHDAIARDASHAASHFNLATALLATGRFAQGWREYAWRAGHPQPSALANRDGRIAIQADQGLGDVLFFLRFAPALRAAGATLDFVGDARLHPILARTGLFASAARRPEDLDSAQRKIVRASDLPLLVPELADKTPPPLTLSPDAPRLASMRGRLAALGPPPYVAVAWRAGDPGALRLERLFKEVPIDALGGALRGPKATWISIQRDPRAGENDALARAIGAPVHDLSAVNVDLEDALALLASIDLYVGVSSTMVHLFAGVGGTARVMVPFPPEWRWMESGDVSSWFPRATVYRQQANGDWEAALAGLSKDLATSR